MSPVGPALPRLAESLRGLKVLVIGDAMLDGYLSGTSGRLCPEAPVPVVAVSRSDEAREISEQIAALEISCLQGRVFLPDFRGGAPQGKLRQIGTADAALSPDHVTG